MRLLLFWSYYENYLSHLYATRPGLANQSYDEQLATILGDHFGWVPPVVRRMEELGFESRILVTNAKHLQATWARERNLPFDEGTWRRSIPMAQVREFSPDVLLIGSMFSYYGSYLKELRRHARSVAAWIAVPVPAIVDLGGIDLVLTSHRHFLDDFRRRGLRAERMLPAFEPKVLELSGPATRDVDASFVGSLTWSHQSRIDLLRSLDRSVPLSLWVTFPPWNWKHLARPGFPRAWWTARDLLRKSQGSVFGREMYAVLRRSRLTINVHLEAAGGLAGNMRMFEATGAGALLLTEEAPNLSEMFEPGVEVIPYRSPQHLLAEIQRLLASPDELARIAAAGQARTLRDHNTLLRANQLADYLR